MARLRALGALILGLIVVLGTGVLTAGGAAAYDFTVSTPQMTIIPTEGTPDPDDPNPPPWPWYTRAFVEVIVDPVAPVDVTATFVTRDGTALKGQDYQEIRAGRVTIKAGQRVGYAEVLIVQDGRCEADETFSVVLTGTSAGRLGNTTNKVVITDDDCPAH